MKKNYSPVKPYWKRKRLRLGYKFIIACVKLFFPKDEYVFIGEKPAEDEPLFFVSNHTQIYAPTSFIMRYNTGIRLWGNYYFLSFKDIWNHLFKKVLKDKKPKALLYPIGAILAPLIVAFFRSMQPIPVYHKDKRVQITFDKSIQTIEEGLHQVIFPERTENPVNDYIFQFNHGFPTVGELYYKKTGKLLKFYPCYTCQSLHKVLIGKPYVYNPQIPLLEQNDICCQYLENQIKELAESLPKHKIVWYG